jgi:hypothetical protein
MRKRGEKCCKLSCSRPSKNRWFILVEAGDTRRIFRFCTKKHRDNIMILMYSTAYIYIAEAKKRSK